MLKLVLLSPGMTGRSHELKLDKTTLGRVDDNTIPISSPTVSGHHCEILLRGSEVVVRDLGSTNGTYINGEKVSESALKISQILRLGEVEMRLESEQSAPASKQQLDRTTVIPGGVSRTQLEMSMGSGVVGTKGTGFSKKSNRVNEVFIIAGVILGLLILGLLIYISATIRK
jgi:pSer/pThr/pTyr-binding forkhead associated (FHA) protein